MRLTPFPPDGPALAGVGVDSTSVVSRVTDELEFVTEIDLVLEKLGVKGWTFMG
jgi:hypothetical protein